MTSINYNEFQPGQGVSAPKLNENFALTNGAIENLELTLNSSVSSLTSTTLLKADKNGSSAEKFNVADATEATQAVNLRQLQASSFTLTGTVIWYAGASVPDGYLLCNGDDVSRTTYADLFDVLGVRFGAGDGTTTFTLPNLINKFIEGANSAGTYYNAGLPNITGSMTQIQCRFTDETGSGALYKENVAGTSFAGSATQHTITLAFDASKSNEIYGGSTTVQPAALTLLPCIKY